MSEQLPLWVIYVNPSDFPDKHVVRKWLLDQPTDEVFACDSLDEARDHVPRYCTCIRRHADDDKVIAEVWL